MSSQVPTTVPNSAPSAPSAGLEHDPTVANTLEVGPAGTLKGCKGRLGFLERWVPAQGKLSCPYLNTSTR